MLDRTSNLAFVSVALACVLASCLTPRLSVDGHDDGGVDGGSAGTQASDGGDAAAGTDASAGTGANGTGGSSGTCGLLVDDSTCASCLQVACPKPCADCANNAACRAILECIEQCNDEACRQLCPTHYPSGRADYEALFGAPEGCLASACVAACPELAVDAGTGGSGGTGTGGTGGAGGTGGSGGTGGPSAIEFDFCSSDADCTTPLVCRAMEVGGSVTRCTRLCSMSSQCMTGTRCTYGTGYCAFDDDGKPCSGTGECGDACAALGYCVSQCDTGLDCPGGWGCAGASTGGKACVRLDQLCDASNYSACLSQAHCDTETMLVGGCTIQCTTVDDCPQRALALSSWSCDQGTCIRPDDVHGSMPKGEVTQWACEPTNNAVVNLCADSLTFDAAPALSCPVSVSVPTTGPCVQSCRYAGGCGHGWACVGLGEMAGQRVGLCTRRGTAEVGQGCTKNEDCLFGLCDNGLCSRDCSVDGVCPFGFSCVAGGSPNVEGKPYRICK